METACNIIKHGWEIKSQEPVADAPGKVQAGLFQMGLKRGLTGSATTLWAHMGCAVLMDPLMGRHTAPVRQHHGGRAKHTSLKKRDSRRNIKELVNKVIF